MLIGTSIISVPFALLVFSSAVKFVTEIDYDGNFFCEVINQEHVHSFEHDDAADTIEM